MSKLSRWIRYHFFCNFLFLIVVPDINLEVFVPGNFFASCCFGQIWRNWLSGNFFAKVVKREVIKNIFYGQSDGRRKGGGLFLQGPRGSRGRPTGSHGLKGVGLQGPRGSRGRPTGSQRVKG